MGDLLDEKMVLNQFGEIVKTEWLKTFDILKNLMLDEYIVMPNHFHGIIIVINNDSRGTLQRAPTFEQFGKPVSNSIPTVIRSFKSATTKRINGIRATPGIPVWQRYYLPREIKRDQNENFLLCLRLIF